MIDFIQSGQHVDRKTDHTGLPPDRMKYTLFDPPRGIGAETMSKLVIELVQRLHQTDITLLNQVDKWHTASLKLAILTTSLKFPSASTRRFSSNK